MKKYFYAIYIEYMLSLYLHIPFCTQKCAYCSFTSFPDTKENKINEYLEELMKEIEYYGNLYKGEEIKTLYIGGGTPSSIGAKNILKLIEKVKEYFNLEHLEEFSMELNPAPEEEVFEVVKTLNSKLKKFPRIRFSFGIQSLDDTVLEESGRPYNYATILNFLRQLREIKQDNNVFNFDFIAFGKFNKTRSGKTHLRDQYKLERFENFVNSGFVDSFSLYTLELFKGSKWHSAPSLRTEGKNAEENDDLIYDEFQILKEIILDGGYARYEISNFALPGKNSIHNMVYRNMQNYLGLGLSASSYLDKEYGKKLDIKQGAIGTRFTNTKNLDEYLKGKRTEETSLITQKDLLIEKFFLKLRMNQGITNIDEFKEVLIPEYEKKLNSYEEQGFIIKDGKKIHLTDPGMDLFNSIITELLQEI